MQESAETSIFDPVAVLLDCFLINMVVSEYTPLSILKTRNVWPSYQFTRMRMSSYCTRRLSYDEKPNVATVVEWRKKKEVWIDSIIT